MRRQIVPHPYRITDDNVEELRDFGFVFLCLDSGPAKKRMIDALRTWGTPFIDVGMGVELLAESSQLWGICRVTTVTQRMHEHVTRRISVAEHEGDDLYEKNIQIAELNALSAALAVVKWKKLCGFYQDLEDEHDSTYTTSTNLLTSDERP